MAIVQRFGGALNLNVHVHALVLDGVFAQDPAGALTFHPAPRLTAPDMAEVLATVEPRITRLLERRGLGDRDDSAGEADAWADEAPALAGLAARPGRSAPACLHNGRNPTIIGAVRVSVCAVLPGRCLAGAHTRSVNSGGL